MAGNRLIVCVMASFVCCVSCVCQGLVLDSIPVFGEDVENYIGDNQTIMTHVMGSFTHEAFEVEVNEITYLVAFLEHVRRVEYISTDDPDFRTPEGYGIHTKIREIQENSMEFCVVRTASVLYYQVFLESGWRAVFGLRSQEDGSLMPLDLDNRINYFYKYKMQGKRTINQDDNDSPDDWSIPIQ